MIDPNDLVTLPLIEPVCKQLFCDFVGEKAFEDDGGWSYEVWKAAWNAALTCVEKKFKHEDGISFHGNEVAYIIRHHVQE